MKQGPTPPSLDLSGLKADVPLVSDIAQDVRLYPCTDSEEYQLPDVSSQHNVHAGVYAGVCVCVYMCVRLSGK